MSKLLVVACLLFVTSVQSVKQGGVWSEWVNGACSKTCGTGSLTMTRTCTNHGKQCEGPTEKAVLCHQKSCPVHLRWSDWKNGACTVTCGKGTLMRQRTCSIPDSTLIGKMNCSAGVSKESVECTMAKCDVNGKWTPWQYGLCGATCGSGLQMRTRTCTNPKPAGEGLPCQGNDKEAVICNVIPCPRNGGWSNWTNGKCTVTCGPGSQMRSRTCTNPTPCCGGQPCQGEGRQSVYCTQAPCGG